MFKQVANLLTVIFLLGSQTAWAVPRHIQATYEIYRSGVRIAMVNEEFSRDRYYYKINSVTVPVGLFSIFSKSKSAISSEGIVGLEGLKPVSYTAVSDQESESKAVLDWSNRKITMFSQGRPFSQALNEGTQDRLSAMYQFMYWPLQGRTFDFMLTNGRKVEYFQYGIAPKQRLKTSLGEIDAIYVYNRSPQGKLRTEIWLSTQHYNLPYKMVVTDDEGDQVTQVLSKIEVQD